MQSKANIGTNCTDEVACLCKDTFTGHGGGKNHFLRERMFKLFAVLSVAAKIIMVAAAFMHSARTWDNADC